MLSVWKETAELPRFAPLKKDLSADVLIVGGTSLVVYPAAGFITYRKAGTSLVLINRDATSYDGEADLVIREDIAQVLEEAVEA